MNTDSETIKTSCKDILQKYSKNRRHQIKKKYFDTVAANKVSIKSPVPDLTDGEWQALVEMWSTPRHKVCLYLFDALCSAHDMLVLDHADSMLFCRKPVCRTRWIKKKSCTITELVPGTTQHTFLPLWELFSRDLTVWSLLNNISDSCWITFWFLLKNISERRA